MHELWIFFLKKRAFTYLVMFSVTVTGLFSLLTIPKESSPEVVVPIGLVSTTLRGASAEDTEKLITDKIEDEVANIENIDKVTSSSLEGVSVVTAQFIASADIDKSIQDLKDAVDRAKAELPKEADEPSVTRLNFADQPIVIASISTDVPEGQLAELGDDLKDELKKLSGISKVTVLGTRKKEAQVIVRKQALERYGIRIDEVIAALASSNASFPIGSINVSEVNYPIKFAGAIDEPSEISRIQVANRGGAAIYLSDIAFVSLGVEAPREYSRISVDGSPSAQAITVYVYKKQGGDVTKIAEGVRDRIEELKTTMLLGADVVVSFDRGELVTKDLRELTRVGLETVGLVLLTLFLTIGWRESVVAALSIPLSFVIAFIGLQASGNTINFLSLFSLILAIGILVDSGIVVTEAIHTRIKKYGSAEKAAIASINEYSWPLIAGTMATVVFFAPLFFLSGIVGKFIASIPFTLIFVLMASLWVALGMVPILAIVLTKEHKNRFEDMQERWFERSKDWYKRFLGSILDSRRAQNSFLLVMGAGFVVALLLPVLGIVKVSFFPAGDQDFIYIQIEKPQGSSLAMTDRATREVEELLYDDPYIESFVTTVGGGSVFSEAGPSAGTKLANITVILKKERGDVTSEDVMEEVRRKLAPISDADIHVEQPSNGPPSGAPVEIKFVGSDLGDLGIAADRAERLLKSMPGTLDVRTSLRDDGTQFEITVDRDKASSVGISSAQIAQTLRTAVSGAIATTIKKEQKDIDVVVKLDLNPSFVNPEDTVKTTIDSIKNVPIATPSGTVLLGSLIKTTIGESRSSISHEDRKRIVSLSAQIKPDLTAVEVTNAFKDRIGEIEIPESVTVKYGGENEDVNKTFAEMGYALLAGMLLAFAILVLEFNSIRFPFYLILIIPLSLIGVFLGLALSGQALSFSSMLGVIALAGVIINHAIILLDSMLRVLRDPDNKLTLRDSIVEASAVRLRPIFLTTITTVIGMIPLTTASPLWGPLAFAIMFGLTFAMVLTLVFTPVFFYRWPGEFKRMKKE